MTISPHYSDHLVAALRCLDDNALRSLATEILNRLPSNKCGKCGNEIAKEQADGPSNATACSGSSEWWVIDRRPDGDLKKRGPFKHLETAAAVRAEMETNDIYDDANLCVVPLPSRQNAEVSDRPS